jgi:hypothetical protein
MADNTNWVTAFESKFGEGANQYSSLIEQAAKKHGVPVELVREVIRKESNFNPQARGAAGEGGLMQLMQPTAKELGVADPFDPQQNIDGGTRYLSQLLQRYQGDTSKALMAYNGGMGNVDRGTISDQARAYAAEVTGRLNASKVAQAPAAQAGPNWVEQFETGQTSGTFKQPQLPKRQAPAFHDPLNRLVKPKQEFSQLEQLVLGQTPEGEQERTWTDTLVDNIPGITGALGGLVGGATGFFGAGVGAIPGSIGGAVAGGSAGEVIKDWVNEKRGRPDTKSFQDRALEVAKVGATEGLYDAAGGVVGKFILKPAAKAFTKAAFKPTSQALKTNPNIVDNILDNGIKLSGKGLEKSASLTTEARLIADEAIQQAQATLPPGRRFVPRDEILDATLNPVKPDHVPVLHEIAKRGRQTPSLNKLGNYANDFIKDNPSQLSLERVREIQRSAGADARRVYEGAEAALERQIDADIHTGAQTALHKRVPGLEALDAETQRRLMVTNTVSDALKRASSQAHIPSAGDQYLLWQGLSGHPGMLALAMLREANRIPKLQALAGRAANQMAVKNAPAQTARVGKAIYGEFKHDQERRKQKTAKKKTTQPVSKKRVEAVRSIYETIPE